VADDPSDGPGKRDEIDKASSEACTRAGAFALLISVLLFLLGVYWYNRRAEEALAEYTTRRSNLAMFLEELQNDPIWQRYLESHPDADRMPLNQLIHARAEIEMATSQPQPPKSEDVAHASAKPNPPHPAIKPPEPPGGLEIAPPKPEPPKSENAAHASAKTRPPNSALRTPAAPTGLTIRAVTIVELHEMSAIVQFWRELNDSSILTKSRETSYFFDLSIAKWANRRGTMMYSNALTGVCSASEIEIPSKFSNTKRYTAQMNDEALMNCITLRNLKELAQFELPQMSNPIQLGSKAGRDVDLSPGSLPRDPYAATLVAEALLFFALVYFSAFAREAVLTKSFPARATLFGAFSGTRWMLSVFLLALWTPFLACCAVGLTSGKVLPSIAAIPVFFATFSAHRTLVSKAFFELIRPSAFLAAYHRRRTGN